LDFVIIGLLAVTLGYFAYDKFVLDPVRDAVDDKVRTTIAVLPFVSMSSGEDDGYFADGLTEEILNALAQLPELLVTARTSAFAFKGQDVSVTDIAAKLGVAHVVEGSVRRAGERLRITAQLIRASDEFHLWSETYERSGEDSFGVQGEIAEKVAAALGVVLDDDQLARMRSSGLRKPEAFIAYQKGLELMARAHEVRDFEQSAKLLAANKYFERTIELEPGFSSAHFNHADYYIHLITDADELGVDSDHITEALEAAKADLRNAAQHATTEGDRLNATLELTVISEQWRRLPELLSAAFHSSECIGAVGWWGSVSSTLDPSRESLAFWQRLVTCDPLRFNNWVDLGQTQFFLGDNQAAMETAKRGLEIVSHLQIANVLIDAYLVAGRFDEALAVSQRYVENERRRHIYRFVVAAAMGDANRAQAILDEIIEKYSFSFNFTNWTILGDRERANQMAAIADAQPLGFLNLYNAIGICACGAPFDLESTPNFARLIDEANFPWPPPAPIEWPLKDW
jgi:TolB-like protein